MHPFITTQSVAAERVRDLQETARRGRDAAVARERRSHQRRASRTAGAARLLAARLRPRMA
jgi:hypothetical protein